MTQCQEHCIFVRLKKCPSDFWFQVDQGERFGGDVEDKKLKDRDEH